MATRGLTGVVGASAVAWVEKRVDGESARSRRAVDSEETGVDTDIASSRSRVENGLTGC